MLVVAVEVAGLDWLFVHVAPHAAPTPCRITPINLNIIPPIASFLLAPVGRHFKATEEPTWATWVFFHQNLLLLVKQLPNESLVNWAHHNVFYPNQKHIKTT